MLLLFIQDSIPLKDGNEITILDDKKNTEAYRLAVEEYRDIIDVSNKFFPSHFIRIGTMYNMFLRI